MTNNLNQVASTPTRPRLLWGLPLVAVLLLLWQIPWGSIAYRQIGMRAFLQVASQDESVAANARWPAFIEIDPNALMTVPPLLQQVNGQLNVERTSGVIALAANDLAEAQQQLLRRLELAPNDVIAHFFLGEVYLRLGDTQTGIEQWEAARAKAPLMKLGQDLIDRQAQAEALAALEAVMRLDAADEDSRRIGYALSGQILFDAGQYEQAIIFFKQALQRNPERPRPILEGLGRSYAALNQWPEAITAYEQALQAEPRRHQVYALMGEAQCQLDQPQDARFYFEQAIALGNRSNRTKQAVEHIARHGACPSK